MLRNIDPTVLYIVTTVIALAWGFFYMRARYQRAHEKFEASRAETRARQLALKETTKSVDDELEEIEKELAGKPIPKELVFPTTEEGRPKKPASILDFKSRAAEKKKKDESPQLVTLEEALKGTKSGLFGRISSLFTSSESISSDSLESIEEVLYTSDLGPQTVQKLINSVSEKIESSPQKNLDVVRGALRDEMLEILSRAQSQRKPIARYFDSNVKPENKPEVWMIVGVNGAGKTTTIGKLANKLAQSGKSVLVAAGDTFRAAAGEQLKVWTDRAQVEIFAPEGVESPSAVAFDACRHAQQKGFDYLIIDTAGRLHTQKNLMEELKKVKRVIDKSQAGAPHEMLLVLDANSGQNALIQAREFHAALDVTGIVLTKLDGTAKGGMAIGVAGELGLPIQLIGVGEGKDDIRPFESAEFVDAIV